MERKRRMEERSPIEGAALVWKWFYSSAMRMNQQKLIKNRMLYCSKPVINSLFDFNLRD